MGRESAGEAEGENGAGVEALEKVLGGSFRRCPAHAAHGEDDVRLAYHTHVQAGRRSAGQSLPSSEAEESGDLQWESGDDRQDRSLLRLPDNLHR